MREFLRVRAVRLVRNFILLILSIVYVAPIYSQNVFADDMPAAYVDGDGLSPDSIRASVADLESQIAAVDAELSDCRHAVSDWKTATIIGGVGVGVTGIGAAVQLNKLNKAKKSGKVETTTEKKKE